LKITLVGRGRVGRGLSSALRSSGQDVTLTRGREPRRAPIRTANLIILCTTDPTVSTTAAQIAPWLRRDAVVLHCAGSLGHDALGSCLDVGAEVGVMHPLVSFPQRGLPPELKGATFVIDGTPMARDVATRVARTLGALPLSLPVHGAGYHAAAALAANGAAGLAGACAPLLEQLGFSQRAAERALGSLLRSVATNIENQGLPKALTGPVARGDAETVRAHRVALARLDPTALAAYDAVGPVILAIARKAGLEPAQARRLQRALNAKATERERPR